MKSVVLFGATGGIGRAIHRCLLDYGNFNVYPYSKKDLDFSATGSYEKTNDLLTAIRPDVVINSSGYFGNNQETHNKIFDINFGSNWAIIRHYMLNPCSKPVRILMIGSICYNEGKDKYMVYAASKAALYNLWQGACKFFAGSNVNIDLVNPQRTRTSMTTNRIDPALQYHEPSDVAEIILDILLKNLDNTHIDTQFK